MRTTVALVLVFSVLFASTVSAVGNYYDQEDQDDDEDMFGGGRGGEQDERIMRSRTTGTMMGGSFPSGKEDQYRSRNAPILSSNLYERTVESGASMCKPNDQACFEQWRARNAMMNRPSSTSGVFTAAIRGSGNVYMRAEEQQGDDEERARCRNLSILECISSCKHTSLLAKTIQNIQNMQVSSSYATIEDQQANVWWNNLVAQLSGTSSSSRVGQGLTFFAPSNKAMLKFTKLVKKYFPVPFTSKIAAALLSYHVAVGYTNQTYASSSSLYNSVGLGLHSQEFMTAIQASPFQAVLLNTGLTCPGFVNLGANVPQVLSVDKCKKTGALQVNFGVHNAPLFTAKIITADVQTKNGVIHVIDKLMILPFSPSSLLVLTGKSSYLAALATSNLLTMVESMPSITFLVPPTAHVDAFNQAMVGYIGAAGSTSTAQTLIQSLWKSHIITTSPAHLHNLVSGVELRTAGDYALSFRSEFDQVLNKNVFYIGGAKVLNCAITRNGVLLYIDRILEIPGVPQVAAINSQFVNDVSCAQV